MKKIGAFAGKFLPPHIGHITEIENCAKQCDELRVVVSENPKTTKEICQKAGIDVMPASLRIKWLKKHFKNNPKIKIMYMDESGLLPFPDGIKEWAELFKKIAGNDINVKFADETYRELNETYFPECEFKCFDRTIIPISATLIRNNPKEYYNYIIDEAKPFFKKYIK